MQRTTTFRHAILAVALVAAMPCTAAPPPDEDQEVVARPLPELGLPAPEEPVDESAFDAEAPPPPPIDLDYRPSTE